VLDKILGALTLVRHAVAITIVTSAAGAMVAGSVDVAAHSAATSTPTAGSATETTKTTAELSELIAACLETKDPQSAECVNAASASGVSREEFWAKVAMSLSERVAKMEPKAETTKNESPKPESTKPPTNTRELLSLVAACVQSHERTSGACDQALRASGLGADDFWAKVSAMLAKSTEAPKTDEPKTVTKTEAPKTDAPKTTDETLSLLIKDCLAKYASASTDAAGPSLASEACRKAIVASGLSSSDFWARFGPKAETRKPEPTKTPEPTRKPTTSPTVSTAQLATLVKDCFDKYLAAKNTGEGGAAAAEACNRAIAASGLSQSAFFEKFGKPGQ